MQYACQLCILLSAYSSPVHFIYHFNTRYRDSITVCFTLVNLFCPVLTLLFSLDEYMAPDPLIYHCQPFIVSASYSVRVYRENASAELSMKTQEQA